MKLKVKISLIEFGEEKAFSIEQIKSWFPPGKFDKRYPQEYLKKWIYINSKYLEFLGVSYRWNDEKKELIFTPNNKVGLAPLRNPYGGKVYGSIVVKPRLGWIKIYDILEAISWRYIPLFLREEEPIISDGVLPRWFKAVDTLEAIYKALSLFMRGINSKQVVSTVPTGTVDWYTYSTKNVPYGKYNQFANQITDYSIDLEIHRQFKGIIEIIAKEISNTKVPVKIKYKARQLIASIGKKLENVTPTHPNVEKLKKMKIPNYYRTLYEKAIQKCIEYINQSKFSIDIGNFYGLPWSIEMGILFEYWVEHWAYIFAKKIGARFYSDIRKNSRIRFYNLGYWKSLSLLKPDIIIEKGDKTLIIEVKYKKHLMYLQYGKYSSGILEEHRHDLHQLLSYMSSSINEKRTGCLIYPKVKENVPNQFSTLINYANTRANVDVILCNVSFQPKEVLTTIKDIWNEKYAPFA